MAHHILLFFCLFTISKVFSTDSKNFLIAPDNSTTENFAVLQYEELTYQSPRKLSIELRIYNEKTDDFKQCSLSLSTRWGAVKSGVSTVRKLTGDKVIFAWYDEMLDGSDRRTRIVTMNDNCHQIHPVVENLPSEPIILPSVANRFDVIIDDEVTCRAVGKRCRVSYNLGYNNAGRVWPLNVNLDWSTMTVERLRNGDFLMHGYDNTTYRVLRVNHLTGENTTLLMQFEAQPQPEFVTSDLSICGIVYPGYDKLIQCVQYDESNEIAFQKRVSFDDPMTLIDVRSVGDKRLFLLAGKANCTGEFDCWKLYGMDVKRDDDNARPSFSHFHCTGNRKDLRVFDVSSVGDRVAVRYACKNDEEFSYNINYFDDY